MTHSGSPSLHAILEELLNEDDSALSEGGELKLPSLEGVQHDDTCYSPSSYTTARGDLDLLNRIDEATADHYTNTTP
jgi:hypothetical protein